MNGLSRIVLAYLLCFSAFTQAACIPEPNPNSSSLGQNDSLVALLKAAPHCPHDVSALRQLFINNGLAIGSALVANEGFHNITSGSYSFFEQVSGQYNKYIINPGELYFGHFTYLNEAGILALDQVPDKTKLMIELIAWDETKGGFNFYELRGDGQSGRWFFRGDSWDIYLDNQALHRQQNPNKPKFGTRLRCSGCHSLGGPIMKELNEPHNDWWQAERPLLLQTFTLDEAFFKILQQTQSPKMLAQEVKKGTRRLFNHHFFKKQLNSLSLQELFRPLFCPVEINFKSDVHAQDERRPIIQIPVEFFIDKRLLPPNYGQFIPTSRLDYEYLLSEFASSFPNTQVQDSDHAWLAPVKAQADIQFVERLLNDAIIDEKFIGDVLAIDLTNPVFSERRCSLLKYIPQKRVNWRKTLLKNLKHAPERQAQELRDNMLNPHHTLAYYQEQAKHYLTHCKTRVKDPLQLKAFYEVLLQRRHELAVSEISKNPLGQILEPGFRVIFPNSNYQAQAGLLNLDLECRVH